MPDVGPAEEEALLVGEAVNWIRSIITGRDSIGLEGDREAAQITDVLPDGQLTVHAMARSLLGLQLSVLIDQHSGPLLESRSILGRPPIDQRTVAVAGRTLIVEAMADLVTDHCTDAAVVDRVVGVLGEERRLQDGGGGDGFVAQGGGGSGDRLRGD